MVPILTTLITIIAVHCTLSFYLGPQKCLLGHSTKISSTSNDPGEWRGGDSDNDEKLKLKKEAIDLIECLTSPTDDNDPGYDVEKDIRRDNLLLMNDYSELKVALKRKGLRTNGDKLEMMVRLLLHTVDPSINFIQATGREAQLKYIDKEDLASKKVRMVPRTERRVNSNIDSGPDAEDIQVLRRGGDQRKGFTQSQRIILDGLTRREIAIQSQSFETATYQQADKISSVSAAIKAYVVGGRDVLKTWERAATVIVLLPDLDFGMSATANVATPSKTSRKGKGNGPSEELNRERSGWQSKSIRVIADELAFANQAIVVVPDIYGTCNATAVAAYSDGILGNITSTLHYCRLEFECHALCLAGAGAGAGHALSATCDLWDAASLALLKLQRQAEFESMELPILGWSALTSSKRKVAFAMRDISEREQLETYDATVQETYESFYGNEDEEEEQNGEEQSAKESVLSVTLSDEECEKMLKEAVASLEPGGEEKEEIEERDVVDMEKLLVKDRRARLREKRLRTEAKSATIMQQAAERAEKSGILNDKSSLSLFDLSLLAPRAVLAIEARGFDVASVSSRLRPFSLFVYGQKQAEESADVRTLYASLRGRASEVQDFAFRVYEGRSAGFVTRPLGFVESDSETTDSNDLDDAVMEADKKCAQDALAMGAMWLDAHCRGADDAVEGRGGTKWQTDEAMAVVPLDSVARRTMTSTSIASFLHDDPTLFANERL